MQCTVLCLVGNSLPDTSPRIAACPLLPGPQVTLRSSSGASFSCAAAWQSPASCMTSSQAGLSGELGGTWESMCLVAEVAAVIWVWMCG